MYHGRCEISTRIASLHAEIGADTSKFESGTKKVKSGLDQQAAAFAKFSADATRNAKSFLAYEAQKAKAIAQTEKAALKFAKEEERNAKVAAKAAAATEKALAREAKEQERVAKAAAKAAEAQRKQSLIALPGLEKGVARTKEWASANAGLLTSATAILGVTVAVGAALNKVSKDTVEYANSVRSVSQISGSTAEDASRLIQVLDDYGVTVEDIKMSSKALKEQGLVPTVETLARLSDGYLAIQDPAKRLEFVQENLGKSGLKYIDVLNRGSEAIRAQGAGIADGLILTQKQVDAARRLELAEDAKNDALQAVSVTLGNKLIPLQTDVLNGLNVWIRAIGIVNEQHVSMIEATDIAGREIYEEQQAFLAAKEGADEMGEGLENLGDTQQETEDQARRMTSAYQGLLSSMFDIQNNEEQRVDNLEKLASKEADIEEKRTEALGDYLAEKEKINQSDMTGAEALKANTEAMVEYQKKIQELDEDLASVGDEREELSEKETEAANKRIYDLEQSRLAGDGVISHDELTFLQEEAVRLDLVSRAAADRAIAESSAADQRVASFMKVQDPMLTDLQIMQELAKFSGTIVDFGINYHSNEPPSMSQPSGASTGFIDRDSGGPGIAGTPYMIGTGAQPEVFVPNSNGSFIPNADKIGGTTYNIVVNNPKKETAENSIRRSLKSLSYTGVAA